MNNIICKKNQQLISIIKKLQ